MENYSREDFLPEDDQRFQRIGAACLSQGQTIQLLQFIQDDNNKVIVKSLGCTLLSPLLCQMLTKDKDRDLCQTAFTHLTQVCVVIMTCCPKKLFHSLLELINDIDPGAIADTVVVLTPHLQTGSYHSSQARGRPGCVPGRVSVLSARSDVPPARPFTSEQEQEDTYGLGSCCTALAAFTRPFVQKVQHNSSKWVTTKEDEELRLEILKL
ncbi:hypothetical protein WMY93_024227 [Mugilogobius chulae]|uniref:Uncharacterized protein n=1 Tax=Mugilogobius chulae TaxID=88201 RepID=A0AAW0N947_9GOBI